MDVNAPARLADKPSIAQQNTERRHSALQRALALVLANALFWQPILVQAQGVVASNPNTQVGQAGNGVPVVNIAAPNASGLSHNQYQQYNVDAQGLILNNATDTAQATQLGGIIQGNPNLQGQAAGVILNEVTGANPSQLKGYTEVAGQAAKVIVANPHGITCNGCGFINTPQATLSTGKPVLDANGQLQRFNVQGGSVAIEGAGLNASNVEQFDIITRSARINAQLHANKLNVITGRNDVDAQTLAATPLADDGSSKPELAIDSSALGGMYAGAVKLVGTEAGVGVKLAGDLAASGGDIQIDANGQLTMAQSAASGNIVAKARDIDVSAPMYAEGQVQLNADKTLTNRKSIAAGQVVSLQADQLNNSGRVEAGVNADNSRNKTGDVRVAARNMTNQGSVTASRDLTANVDARLDNRKGQLLSQDSLNVSAGQLDNQDGKLLSDNSLTVKGGALDNGNGTLSAIKSVTVQNDRLTNRSDGQVTSGGALNLHVQNLDNLGGMVSARETVTVKAGRFDNSNGTLVGSGGVNLELLQQLTNSNAKVVSGGDLLISGNAQIDNRNGRLSSQGLLSLMAAQVDNRNKGVITANSLSIDAKNIDNQNGILFSKGRLQLRGSGLDNRNGEIAGNQLDFGLTGALLNSYGVIESSASLTLGAARLDNSQGQIGALGSTGTTELNISGTLDNSRGRLQSANQHMDFSLGRLTNNEGVIAHAGSGRLGLGLPLLQDAGGRVSSNGTLSLSGERWTNSSNVQAANLDLDIATLTQTEGGRLIAAKRFTGRGQNWTNNGLIGADGDLTLSLSGSYTGAGRLTSLGTLELSAPSVLNRGIITSAGDMRLLVNDFTNQRGHLYSLGDLQISADAAGANANSIINRSGTLTSDGDMLLAARSIQNIRDLLTVNDAGIYSAQINEIACTTAGTGNLDCSGGKEHHVWNIQQLEKLEVTAFSEASSITAGGDITLRGTDFLNSSSTLASSGALTANFSNNFSNIGVVPSTTHTSRTFISERTRSPGGWYALADDFTQRYSQGGARYNANDLGGLEAAMSNFIASTEREVTELRTINRQTPDQQSFAALIQAGGNVSIETGNNFDNRAVQRGFTYVSGGERTNIDAPGTAHATAIRLDSQLSPDLAQQQINPTTLPGFSLPSGQNGLFQLADEASGGALLNTTGAGSHPYLIETNPALTDMRQFLSSSYLLDNLGYNPDTQWKRLGDGYYEQRLVQQAVVSRTGQRYLAGLTSDEATFKYLMDNALASRDALKLSVGVSLTGEQVAALTHDIVWMEEQQVQGQRVLVPVLYLAQADNRLAANGALIQGNDLQLIAGNNLNNVGTLLSRNNLSAKAGNTLLNSGLIQTEQRLALEADNNLINHAGGVISGHDVSLLAKDGSVSNERSVTRHQSAMGASVWREDFADNPARIESAGDLQAKAGKNINNIGGVMQAQGGVRLEAGQDVNIAAVETQTRRANGPNQVNSTITQNGAQLSATKNSSINAERNLDITASQVNTQGNLALSAGQDIRVQAAANQNEYISRSKKVSEENRTIKQQASDLQAEGNLSLDAGNNLEVVASKLKAQGNVTLDAAQDISLTSALDEEARFFSKRSKGSFRRSSSEQRESYASTNVATRVEAGQDILVNVTKGDDGSIGINGAENVTVIGSQLKAGNDLMMGASTDVAVLSGVEEHGAYSEKSKSGFMGLSKSGKSELQTSATQVGSELRADGDVVVASGKDIRLRASAIKADNDVELRSGLVDKTGDINLVAANDEAYSRSEEYRKKAGLSVSGGFLSISSAKQAGREAKSSTSVGSQVIAERDASLQAERDINVVGSRIQAGGNVNLDAGRDVNILAAQNSHAESDWEKKRQSGIGISGDDNGVTLFAGIERNAEKNRVEQQTAAASQISARQDLGIRAKQDINQVGSDLLAVNDIDLTAGRNIRIDSATETLLTEQQREQQRNGLSATANHNFGSTKDAVNKAGQGEDNVSKASSTLRAIDSVSHFLSGPTGDGKFGKSTQSTIEQSIEQTSRGSTLDAGNDVTLSANNDVQVFGGQMRAGRDINVSGRDVMLDVAKNSSSQETRERQSWSGVHGGTSGGFKLGVGGSNGQVSSDASQSGSTATVLEVGRDINLLARNDLTLVGTQATADRNINLHAGNDLNVRAARNDLDSQNTRKSGGGEVGLSVGSKGVGVYASVNLGRGNLERDNQLQQPAYLYAGNLLSFTSGQDTNINGAILRGDEVLGRVGRDLNVSSAIDTGKAEGKEYDVSVTVTLGPGSGVSGSAGYGRTNGSTRWVQDQTRITGKNSVDVRTEKHTQLDGALIAADNGNLKLDTGTLGFSDIAGKDKEHGFYLNAGGSYGTDTRDASVEGKGSKDSDGWNLEGWNYERDREQSVRATVGSGKIVVRNDAQTGADSTTGLNRDVDKAYEITRDDEKRTDVYASSRSINAARTPFTTVENWSDQLLTYDETAQQNYEQATRDANLAINRIEKALGRKLDSGATTLEGADFAEQTFESLLRAGLSRSQATKVMESPDFQEKVLSELAFIAGVELHEVKKATEALQKEIESLKNSAPIVLDSTYVDASEEEELTAAQNVLRSMAAINSYAAEHPTELEAVQIAITLAQGPKGMIQMIAFKAIEETPEGKKILTEMAQASELLGKKIANLIEDKELHDDIPDEFSLIGGGVLMTGIVTGVVAGRNGKKTGKDASSTADSRTYTVANNEKRRDPCCFAAGTKVSTPYGDRAIETLRIGDIVWSKPEKGGKPFAAAITATHVRNDQPIYRLTLKGADEQGNEKREHLLVTPSHPFYVPAQRDFIPVSDLKTGDRLQSLADGATENTSSEVESLELYAPVGKTYNLTVDVGHTFYVGDLKTWVHNTGPCDPAGRGEAGSGGARGSETSSDTPKGVTNPEISKLDRPSIPEGMTQSQFGKNVIGWGARPEGALQRLETINSSDVASMQKQGLTREMATQWKDFYSNEFARNANNFTARNRVKLMQKILDNWN
ncbi:DUF4951 domain-containing protein [Pseudomonas sp. 21LCFQ010]|uniref:DUF4951 domain-containing protein n=1 Tax=Pseudomonas sp. 21LCFQ010 TaxID=2957506 RepID=UPI002096BDEE|nr:DUF4951 domain-containing protein [Pseudomonas sp. 21LCFQ010]MCO8161692.1 DUF4951 domain-containing protein [Pseudomonas sp. 21LCFQ010]